MATDPIDVLDALIAAAQTAPAAAADRPLGDGRWVMVEVQGRGVAFWHLDDGDGYREVPTSEVVRALEDDR